MSDEARPGSADFPIIREGDNGDRVCLIVPAKDGGRPTNAPHALVTEEGHILGQPLSVASGLSTPEEDAEALAKRHRLPDYARRLRAFELFAVGERQANIALQLGVSQQMISRWKVQDHWDLRLEKQREKAVQASDFLVGNLLAETVTLLRSKVKARVLELESLAADYQPPQVRLGAIKLWLELAARLEAEMLKGRAAGSEIPGGTGGVPVLEITGA